MTFLLKATYCGAFLLLFAGSCFAQERYIQITSGGGVVGTATRYKISLDGKVLKGKGLGEIIYTEESKLKKRLARKYFKKSNALVAGYPGFNYPGNMYYSLLVYNQGTESKMTWGDTAHEVPEVAVKLYQEINAALTRLTFAPESHK